MTTTPGGSPSNNRSKEILVSVNDNKPGGRLVTIALKPSVDPCVGEIDVINTLLIRLFQSGSPPASAAANDN